VWASIPLATLLQSELSSWKLLTTGKADFHSTVQPLPINGREGLAMHLLRDGGSLILTVAFIFTVLNRHSMGQ